MALGFLGPAVLYLAQDGGRHRDSLAGGHQEITGITGGHFNKVPIPTKAQYVFTENNLYALGHDDETGNLNWAIINPTPQSGPFGACSAQRTWANAHDWPGPGFAKA